MIIVVAGTSCYVGSWQRARDGLVWAFETSPTDTPPIQPYLLIFTKQSTSGEPNTQLCFHSDLTGLPHLAVCD